VTLLLTALAVPAAALPSLAGPATAHTTALNAAVDVARESAALDALGGFGPTPFTPLEDSLRSLPLVTGSDHAGLLAQLDAANRAGAAQLQGLQGSGAALAQEVQQVLTPLSPTDRAAAAAGRAISIRPNVFLGALDDLLARDGAPPSNPTPPQPPQIHDALAAALNGAAPPSSTAAKSGHTGKLLLAGLVAALVLLALAAAAWLLRRRPPRPQPVMPASTLSAPSASMHGVLEASRRLTAGTVGEDINRAVVREMLGLVPGRAGALLVKTATGFGVTHETQPGLLAPTGFTRGLVADAVRTGNVRSGSTAGDASFVRGDLQVAVAPLVAQGDVIALMVVVRDPGAVFAAGEQQMLGSLAPVAAAALQSAARTRAAVDASLVDPLTGVGNRRGLDAHLPTVLASTAGRATGFVMVDLDHFKSVNDTHGHPAGDSLLRGVCAVIRETIRPADAVYRYGGEEFCLVLPGTAAPEAEQIADRVRVAIATTPFDIGTSEPLSITASLGVAVSDGTDPQTLVARADAALYEAKRAGRDRVCVA